MKVLVTGKNGQLGWELARTLITNGQVIALGRDQIDLENPGSIVRAIRCVQPNLIINAAAYTAVDQAETDEQRAYAVNGIAPGIIAEEAKRIGAGVIHYSTDYVFDGKKDQPYTEEDLPNPLNVYGRSKLAGEQAIAAVDIPYLILRTSWVYGKRGGNFMNTMLRLATERDEITVVNDQLGAPTWARLIAQVTAHILTTGHPLSRSGNVYHLTACGATTWFGFANTLIQSMETTRKLDKRPIARVIPILSSDYVTPAIRPANSMLCCDKLTRAFNLYLPHWEDGLRLCVQD